MVVEQDKVQANAPQSRCFPAGRRQQSQRRLGEPVGHHRGPRHGACVHGGNSETWENHGFPDEEARREGVLADQEPWRWAGSLHPDQRAGPAEDRRWDTNQREPLRYRNASNKRSVRNLCQESLKRWEGSQSWKFAIIAQWVRHEDTC